KLFKKQQEEGSRYYNMGNTLTRHAAFISNATYSYEGRYTFNGTLRYEGSNRLGKTRSSRWLPTWNLSGAWNAHEEKFFDAFAKPIALSHLSARVSYSLTADRGPASVSNSRVEIASETPWRPSSRDQESVLYIRNPENSGLTYEKKHEMNFGMNLGFLENRINVEFDIYQRNNFDLIGPISTLGTSGHVIKYGNVANMESNGFELSISTRNYRTKDFTWTTDFIYSHSKNKVTKLDNRQRVIDLVTGNGFAVEGRPVRSIFSIPFMGLIDEGLPTFLDQDGEISITGIYFQERDNIDFLLFSGSVDPTDLGSLGNTFSYKGFRLNVFITYSMGNVVRLDPVFASQYTDLTSMPREFKNRWVVPGDEHITTVPIIASRRQLNVYGTGLRYAYNAYNFSDERIARGDFIRMKEISLSYDFPSKLLERMKLSSLSLKIQATNPFLLYADKKLNGQDPEFFNTGGVAAPVPKQFTTSLRIGL
ncbi:MAG: TonB-dependent receptor, partial [Bacteroidales bacterium]|nr:TonB-dependent receptor [Bacteroidales bacterium]